MSYLTEVAPADMKRAPAGNYTPVYLWGRRGRFLGLRVKRNNINNDPSKL